MADSAKIDRGKYYYTYCLTPEFLDSRKRMVLYYAGVKTFFQILVDLFLLKLFFYLCFTFPPESRLFLWGVAALVYGLMDIIITTVRFLFIYCDNLQGKRIKREHYRSSPRYLGEDQRYVYYFKDYVLVNKVYDPACLSPSLNPAQEKQVKEFPFYKRMRRFTYSLRFMHFSYSKKQSCLAAIDEILMYMLVQNNWDSTERK